MIEKINIKLVVMINKERKHIHIAFEGDKLAIEKCIKDEYEMIQIKDVEINVEI